MQNVKTNRTGNSLTITIDLSKTVKAAGTLTGGKDPKPRKNDLVATSGGFAYLDDGIGLSVNVTRPPADTDDE